MPKGAITEYIDVAQLMLYAFWIFFLGLIYYLRREDKREGYPLVYDRPENRPYLNFPPIPAPKTFLLPHGKTVQAPRPEHASYAINAEPVAGWTGAPLVPIGNPMLDAIGPGAYAMREDVPDMTYDGLIKIVPLRIASGQVVVKTEAAAPKDARTVDTVQVASTMELSPRDPDPRGMLVIGADGNVAGIVTDVWVDRSEVVIRYLQVDVDGVASIGPILLPMNFSKIDGARRQVKVEAILASQFANVPALKSPDQVTLLEEDKVCAYYGGGTLYATPIRSEFRAVNEHEVEPIRGLPESLPQGERILWQGAPEWKALAFRALHVRTVLAYFALLFVWSVGMSLWDGASIASAVWIALRLVPVTLAATAILGLYAWLAYRTTVYTVTNRRVVLRFGVALPMTLNVPFSVISNAALKGYRDGTGDIPLTLTGEDRMSYIALWPHVRPWHTARPEPMLRAVPDAATVANMLADALAKAACERTVPKTSLELSLDATHDAPERAQAAA